VRLLEDLRLQHHNGIVAEPEPATTHRAAITITYRALFVEWMQAIQLSLEESTQRHYRTAINIRLNPRIGDRVVSDDDYLMLQSLFNDELAPLYAPYTLHTTYSTLNMALEYAVEPRGYISKNPAAKIYLPPAEADSPSVAMTLEELLSILRIALGHRYCPAILFAALTGVRLSECVGIQVSDIDPAKNTIHIQRQLIPAKSGGLEAHSLKTKASDRYIPRLPRLTTYLEKYMLERSIALRYLGYTKAEGGWIFLNSKGDLLSPRLVEEAFDEIVEQTGLAEKYPAVKRAGYTPTEGSSYKPKACAVSFHDLRHTLLTQLGDLGMDEPTKARIAGHGPKNVTQRYDRGTLLRMRAGMEAFEEIIFRALGLEGDGGEA
jgi:integrase